MCCMHSHAVPVSTDCVRTGLHTQGASSLPCPAPAALLMGCSSARLAGAEGAGHAAVGPVATYVARGCPCAVANLWDVTDRDIDRFTERLLSRCATQARRDTSIHAALIAATCICATHTPSLRLGDTQLFSLPPRPCCLCSTLTALRWCCGLLRQSFPAPCLTEQQHVSTPSASSPCSSFVPPCMCCMHVRCHC
jgi:hypothetical protein